MALTSKQSKREVFDDGTKVQRDLYSAFLLKCSNEQFDAPNLKECFNFYDKFKKQHDLKINEKYKPIIIVLNREREHLYKRIDKRVDIMMENGLIEEVKNLLNMGYTKDMISMQGIGYKEIIKYLEGEYELDEAIEIIKRDSRRYAKRQLTWFRRYDDAKWFNLDEYDDSEILKQDIISHIEKML